MKTLVWIILSVITVMSSYYLVLLSVIMARAAYRYRKNPTLFNKVEWSDLLYLLILLVICIISYIFLIIIIN